MAKNGTIAYVAQLPQCNFCPKPAEYDFKTRTGPWGFGCKEDWEKWRMYSDLGIGKGQQLVVRS